MLRNPSQNLQALQRVLRDDPFAAILPLKGGTPVLTAAMHRKCSAATLRMLLEHGAQPAQVDCHGRTALDALLAMTVPDTLRGRFQVLQDTPARPCPVVTRLHVQYAILLLSFGAPASPNGEVGYGNEICAVCARSYGDAMAAAVLRQWMQQEANKDFLSIVADFLHA